jgi:hypothetical protein
MAVQLSHVMTQTVGQEKHMIGLGDLVAYEIDGEVIIYTASAMAGGVTARAVNANLATRNSADYGTVQGLDAQRQLTISEMDGDAVLMAVGRYGDQIEAWQIDAKGDLAEQKTLTMTGGNLDALTGMVDLSVNGTHMFVTASRNSDGLEVWTRDSTMLEATGKGATSAFVKAGAVQDLAMAMPNGVPYVMAISTDTNDLMAFEVLSEGVLGPPTRLDARDGLYISTPPVLEVVEYGGQSYAIVGAAGSSSISVVVIDENGRMDVTSQVNDTRTTFFNDLVALETLEAEGHVFVLAAGSDNGITLMTLALGGTLSHVVSLDDEMREMALLDPGGLKMVWRDGGLDAFVTGQVLDQDGARRGITQLRIDDAAIGLPQPQQPDSKFVFQGTSGVDVFVLQDTTTRQVVYDFEVGVDRLDMSLFGRVYDIDELTVTSRFNGIEFGLGDALVKLISHDGERLYAEDYEFSDLTDLWQIDVSKPPEAPLSQGAIILEVGTAGPDFLDGRDGDDILLGQPRVVGFDDASAQVFRLYQSTLDRAPDLVGLMNWAERLESGVRSLVEVAGGFTNSAEFKQTYGATDNQDFVTLLYDNVLGREPDATGLGNWSGRLDEGMTRAQVVVGFSESAEFSRTTAAEALGFSRAGLQADFCDDTYRLYRATLDRDPDVNGFLNWSDKLAGGMSFVQVVLGFTNSAEFKQTYGATDNQDFVTLLYDNVLDRAPDATGLANWSARLQTAEMTRAQVVQGFAQSAEFRKSTAPELAEWVKDQGRDDVLNGGGGDNILMGGMMSDTFVFRASQNGQNVVVDLEPWDVLHFGGFRYESISDVADYLTADRGNVIFNDDGVIIKFLDVTMTNVLDVDFEF